MKKKTISYVLLLTLVIGSLELANTPVSTSASTTGTWKKTGESYYALGSEYVSRQNESYKYLCEFKGKITGGYVRFSTNGGYQEKDNIDVELIKYDCMAPKDSYKSGEKATLKIRMSLVADSNTSSVAGGSISAYIAQKGNSEKGDGFFNSGKSNYADFSYQKDGRKTTNLSLGSGQKDIIQTMTADMPNNPKNGEEIAIIFLVKTAYDNMGDEKSDNYGGYMFYEWKYKFEKSKPAKVAKPATPKIKSVSPAKGKATIKWKSVKGAKGYQVQWSTTKKFKKVSKKTTTKTKLTIKKLKHKKKYYFKVRSYKMNGKNKVYSSWSKVIGKKIK